MHAICAYALYACMQLRAAQPGQLVDHCMHRTEHWLELLRVAETDCTTKQSSLSRSTRKELREDVAERASEERQQASQCGKVFQE